MIEFWSDRWIILVNYSNLEKMRKIHRSFHSKESNTITFQRGYCIVYRYDYKSFFCCSLL